MSVAAIQRRIAAAGVEYASPTGVRFLPLPDDNSDEALAALEALWLENRVEETADGYRIPLETIYSLEPAEARALSLPLGITPVSIELRTVGAAQSAEFGFRAIVRLEDGQVVLPETRHGPFVTLGSRLLLAPKHAANLLAITDAGCGAGLDERLLHIGEVKRAAEAAGASIDPFLQQQDIVVPEGIGVQATVVSPDEIRLSPVLEGVDDPSLSEVLESGDTVKPAYIHVAGKRKRRIAVDPLKRVRAQGIKDQVVRGPDVPRFLTNPEAFLPEDVDLARYSMRVRGLVPRKYTSQPYLRAERKSREWFGVSVGVEMVADVVSAGAPSPAAGSASPEAPPRTEAPEAPPSVSPDQYAGLCRQVLATGERFVRHGDDWIEIDPPSAEKFLQGWDQLEDDGEGGKRLPAARAGLVLDVIDNLEELTYDEAQARPSLLPEIPEYPLPASLRADLRPHQTLGYRWMRFLHESRRGGLLADDMGLGKTVQVISLLAHLRDAGLLEPTLVVLPTALIANWASEIRRFAPDIRRVYHHTGDGRLRDPRRIAQAEVVLTTYQTLLRDQLILGQVDWQVVISDEAQYVKNPTAQSTAVLKAMKAKHRLAMTGTPVENGLSELWCIVDFVEPGRLGSQREFRSEYERPMADAADRAAQQEVGMRLQRRLSPHYLRRIKRDVLADLPPLDEVRIPCGLSPRQKELYGGFIERLREGDTIPIAAIQKLLMVCSHSALIDGPAGGHTHTPKLQATLDVLERIRAVDERVLLFTRFKGMQQILQNAIHARFGVHAPIVNGDVAGANRLELIDRFNASTKFGAMILAPEAAGVGLNITGANHVVHYTRLWNPAKESQATDRVHRFGQTRPVTVYYPIVVDDEFTTVEARLDELLEDKRELSSSVIYPSADLDASGELRSWLMKEAERTAA